MARSETGVKLVKQNFSFLLEEGTRSTAPCGIAGGWVQSTSPSRAERGMI